IQTWRPHASPQICRTSPTATGLADVVCRTRHLSRKSLVDQLLYPRPGRLATGASSIGTKPFSQPSSALPPRAHVRLHLRHPLRTPTDRHLVATKPQRRLPSDYALFRRLTGACSTSRSFAAQALNRL